MEDWKLISVIIGVIGALLGVYLREALRLAYQQKAIASRLNSYLLYWQKTILEEEHLFDITYLGIEWHKEYINAIHKGFSAEDLVKLDEKWEKKIKEIKEAIENEDPTLNINEEEVNEQIAKVKHRFGVLLEFLNSTKQNIMDAKSYISDQEAGLLGFYTSDSVIELKMRMISLIETGYLLVTDIQMKDDRIKLKEHANELYSLFRAAILTSKSMERVKSRVYYIKEQSLGKLILKNMTGQLR